MGSVVIGLDSGSTSVNACVARADGGEIVEVIPYRRHFNYYEKVAREVLQELAAKYDVAAVNITGSTGKSLQRAWKGSHRVAEVQAHATGAWHLFGDVNAVLDGGGSEIKFLMVGDAGAVTDFAMNPECAAGSGNFLDVQAKRLMLSIDDDSDPQKHFPTLGLRAIEGDETVPISGRCSVFAKTDMIHQQQKAVGDAAIVGGLHEALVNNIKATIIQNKLKGFGGRMAMTGGLSQNAALVHCVKSQFGLDDGQLVVGPQGYAAGAIGAALAGAHAEFDMSSLDASIEGSIERGFFEALTDDYADEKTDVSVGDYSFEGRDLPVDAYMGIDVGSVSTNVVIADGATEEVIVKSYLGTKGKPIEAVKEGCVDVVDQLTEKLGLEGEFGERCEQLKKHLRIMGACTTGSGRFMTGHFVKADIIKNEITAQATGAVRLASKFGLSIDTIFEIGGQDSKYIKLNSDGGVRDYTMNKVCAAGCGSFLEEQAEKLALNIKEEFSSVALSAERPADLGDRCTVFIESVLDHLSSLGETRENVVAGLGYSVANNYLNRVVEGRDTEGNVFFQGGTAYNEAVVRAFQKILRKPVTVTPHNEVTGAVGAALIAKDEREKKLAAGQDASTTFDGISEVVEKRYEASKRICHQCPNSCELSVAKVFERAPDGSEKVRNIYYGDRCDEMNLNQGRGRSKSSDTFIDKRNALLFDRDVEVKAPVRGVIGVPRAMSMWSEDFPFWRRLFAELGYLVELSAPTSKGTVRKGSAASLADFCVPIRNGHGAVLDLLERDESERPDFIFIPQIINYPRRNPGTNSYACLWTQCFPMIAGQAISFEEYGVKLLAPIVEFLPGLDHLEELIECLSSELGVTHEDVRRAVDAATAEKESYLADLRDLARLALDGASEESPVFLVIGRPYNSCDPGLSLDIATKLGRLGHPAVPMDFLPIDEVSIGKGHENMYWKNGERVVNAFRYCSGHDWLIPVWITNFGCGPDSFIRKQVDYVMGDHPYLELELDEHTADAGAITRIEAFYDSYLNTLEFERQRRAELAAAGEHVFDATIKEVERPNAVMAFSYMDDGAFALAAIFRSRGIEAIVMPRTTEETLALGRRYSSGKECVPYQSTLGDKLNFILSEQKRYMRRPDRIETFDREIHQENIVFFDPFAAGPCRFGLYNEGYKRVYERLGIKVKILASGAHNNYGDTFTSAFDLVKFNLLAFDSITACDVLEKVRHLVRPREKEKGTTDRVYEQTMAELISVLERPGNSWAQVSRKRRRIERLLAEAAERFRAIDAYPEDEYATVGMFGEIYVRSEPFINEHLIRRLEDYRIRTVLAPVHEWIQYVNLEFLWDHEMRMKRRYSQTPAVFGMIGRFFNSTQALGAYYKDRFLPRRVAAFEKPFAELLGPYAQGPAAHSVKVAEEMVPFNIKGELILSWGVALELEHEPQFHGIVNIGPFGCMPSKVVTTLLKNPQITKPVYDATYDGTRVSSRDLKIETFAAQVNEYAAAQRSAAGATAVVASGAAIETGGRK